MASSPNKRVGGWSKDELAAIGAYATKHDLKLTMCSRPTAQFLDKDGKLVKKPIQELVTEWSQQKEEDRKHRLYEKRRAQQEAERASWGRRVV